MEKLLMITGLLLIFVTLEVCPASVNNKRTESGKEGNEQNVIEVKTKAPENVSTIPATGNEEQECKPYNYCKYFNSVLNV